MAMAAVFVRATKVLCPMPSFTGGENSWDSLRSCLPFPALTYTNYTGFPQSSQANHLQKYLSSVYHLLCLMLNVHYSLCIECSFNCVKFN